MVKGGSSRQDIETYVTREVSMTEQAEDEIDFIVENTPPGRALVFGEKKKQLVTSLCQKFAIEVCKKIDSETGSDT